VCAPNSFTGHRAECFRPVRQFRPYSLNERHVKCTAADGENPGSTLPGDASNAANAPEVVRRPQPLPVKGMKVTITHT
jgi:hypothetical protein